MANPTLLSDGDLIERETWPEMEHVFPHYQDFWQFHIWHLRSANSIFLRGNLDESFEELAMFHYSTYVSLAEAHQRIQNQREMILFPHEVYWHLGRAGEIGLETIQKFSQIFKECTGQAAKVNAAPLDDVLERIRAYRNLIHAPIQAVGTGEENSREIPKPDKLEFYRKWSDTFYRRNPDDFVGVDVQLNADFQSLASALEGAWKMMCDLSNTLCTNRRYLERRSSGISPSTAVSIISGTFINVSSASASASTRILTRKS